MGISFDEGPAGERGMGLFIRDLHVEEGSEDGHLSS